MKITKAKEMVKQLMIKNQVFGWKAYFTSNECDAGVTFFNCKIIEFCEPFFTNNRKKVCQDTVLHEIAHVLTYKYDQTHGTMWKGKCVEIGAFPDEFLSSKNFPKIVMPRTATKMEKIVDAYRMAILPKNKSEIVYITRGMK